MERGAREVISGLGACGGAACVPRRRPGVSRAAGRQSPAIGPAGVVVGRSRRRGRSRAARCAGAGRGDRRVDLVVAGCALVRIRGRCSLPRPYGPIAPVARPRHATGRRTARGGHRDRGEHARRTRPAGPRDHSLVRRDLGPSRRWEIVGRRRSGVASGSARPGTTKLGDVVTRDRAGAGCPGIGETVGAAGSDPGASTGEGETSVMVEARVARPDRPAPILQPPAAVGTTLPVTPDRVFVTDSADTAIGVPAPPRDIRGQSPPLRSESSAVPGGPGSAALTVPTADAVGVLEPSPAPQPAAGTVRGVRLGRRQAG